MKEAFGEWRALEAHFQQVKNLHMSNLFAEDPERAVRFSLQLGDIFFDYSKHRIVPQTLDLLVELAKKSGVERCRDEMFCGAKINFTENRSVLHTALRSESGKPIFVDGEDIMPKIFAMRKKMRDFCKRVQSGAWLGESGKPITDIVNIGIGGSDLGPQMVCRALRFYKTNSLRVHFVSNIDPTHLATTLAGLDPATTLFLVVSKTFVTQETLTNARAAKEWLVARLGKNAVSRHFVALSSNEEAVREFGIDTANMFAFRDWVGGRYSLWSVVGLSIALQIGMDGFERLLHGAYLADEHFAVAPLQKNIPVIMALLGIWYSDFFGAKTQAILPYEQYLSRFPAYLQQVEMESNGKSVQKNGQEVERVSGAIVWGEVGTNAQHAFFQLLHQGTHLVPCDFLIGANSLHPIGEQHTLLFANFLAQTEALMCGKTVEQAKKDLLDSGKSLGEAEFLAPHKTFCGNRPSSSFVYKKLTPEVLGMLIAFYEHKIFVQGVIWGINSFDQMGVELGKELATSLLPVLQGKKNADKHDASTRNLLQIRKKFANGA